MGCIKAAAGMGREAEGAQECRRQLLGRPWPGSGHPWRGQEGRHCGDHGHHLVADHEVPDLHRGQEEVQDL